MEFISLCLILNKDLYKSLATCAKEQNLAVERALLQRCESLPHGNWVRDTPLSYHPLELASIFFAIPSLITLPSCIWDSLLVALIFFPHIMVKSVHLSFLDRINSGHWELGLPHLPISQSTAEWWVQYVLFSNIVIEWVNEQWKTKCGLAKPQSQHFYISWRPYLAWVYLTPHCLVLFL